MARNRKWPMSEPHNAELTTDGANHRANINTGTTLEREKNRSTRMAAAPTTIVAATPTSAKVMTR